MPELGEIKNGNQIGLKNKCNHIWAACEDCGVERWVKYSGEKLNSRICRPCQGKRSAGCFENNRSWKGGRRIDGNGYVCVMLEPSDFFFSMADSLGYVKEHRLIMAKYLGRCLQPWEIVHHKNGDKTDNRKENLGLMLHGDHSRLTNHHRWRN